MSSKTKIFVMGATGYLGGSVVARLLDHPNASSFQITAFVRSPAKGTKLETVGLKTIIGSINELDKLERAASEADVVFSIADADDVDSMKATLRGLRKRYETTKKMPILIHTSGTGVLCDDAKGMFATDTVYSDSDVEAIDSLPPTALHRMVDMEIVKADTDGYAKTYIILPSTIYGTVTGKIADLGVQNIRSIQLPGLIKISLARGQAGIVGEGKNIWANVEIGEIADLYIILYDSIMSNPDTAHGREGFYFGENDEYTLYEASKAISEALLAHGKTQTLEPTNFTEDEYKKIPSLIYYGTNSRCRADRSRSIGWKPVKKTTNMLASIKPEVDGMLKEMV